MKSRLSRGIVLGLVVSAPIVSQRPEFLREVFPRTGPNPSSSPHSFVSHGQSVLMATDRGVGVSDRAGSRVSPLRSGPVDQLVVAGGNLFFTRGQAVHTLYGGPTVAQANILYGAAVIPQVIAFGPNVVFSGAGEPWISDGTFNGTSQLVDINPGPNRSDPASFVHLGQQVCFVADDGTRGRELWITDGTASGTAIVADLRAGAGDASIEHMVGSGGRVWFFADSGGGTGLFTSDGTASGTRRLATVAAHRSLVPFGAGAMFLQQSAAGQELWMTDGTAAGTRSVANVGPATTAEVQTRPIQVGSQLYFVIVDGRGDGALWVSDGSAGGTRRVSPSGLVLPRASTLASLGLQVFYAAGVGHAQGIELWSTDGVTNGLVADIRSGSGSSSPTDLTTIGGRVWMQADDGVNGREPWVSDGTTRGTRLVGNVANWTEATLPSFTAAAGRQWFFVSDGSSTTSTMWSTDGTSAGTRSATVPAKGAGRIAHTLFTGAGQVLFDASRQGNPNTYDLWRTDGTQTGTVRIKRDTGSVRSTVDMTSYALFAGGQHSSRLWRTDGTTAGTYSLDADVSTFFNFGTEAFLRIGDRAFFPGAFQELFVTDGSKSGTGRMSALANYRMISAPAVLDGRIVYIATGNRLVVTDGTTTGTAVTPVRRTYPGEVALMLGTTSRGLFFALHSPISGGPSDLYFVDAATAGLTHLVSSSGGILTGSTFQTGLHFTWETPGAGTEPWVSDGTVAGTHMVADVNPGPGSSFPFWGVSAGSRFHYFVGLPYDNSPARMFRSDGRGVAIANGFDHGPWPVPLGRVGDHIVFFGSHDTLGDQLFTMPLWANTSALGVACAGGPRVPTILGNDPVLGSTFRLELSSRHASQAAVGLIGEASDYSRIVRLPGGCEIVVDLSLPTLPMVGRTDASGRATWQLPIPNIPALSGVSLATQVAVGKSATVLGTDVSAGLRISMGR